MGSRKSNITTTPRVRWVTARWLRDTEACHKARQAFLAKYGSKVKVRPIACVQACWHKRRYENWAYWLLYSLLSRPLQEAWVNERVHWLGPQHARRVDYRYARMISAPKEAKK